VETFGKYQLVRRLGAGGMAEVFLARTTVAQGLAKLLVIKKIHSAFAKSKHFVTMFVDEAKIALSLNHPNVVQVFDFGHVGQTYYLAMEYVEGLDLLRLLQEGAKRGRRVPYGLSAYIVQQIAKGLDYAHRKADEYGEPLGIVHRDVSPQNVLVSWDGAVKIVDFGIARARDSHEEEGVVKGKFAYMSPEQARGSPVDRRSDIFAAGIVLYELACARPLFVGKGKEVLEAVKSFTPAPPREVDPELPPRLEEILLRALAPRPEDRYDTARDLQHDLGKFQYQHARSQDDLYDSGTLAQFVAQIAPRERVLRPTSGALTSASGTSAQVTVRQRAHGPTGDLSTQQGRASRDRGPLTTDHTFAVTPSALAEARGDVAELALAPAAPPLPTRERKYVLVVHGRLAPASSPAPDGREAFFRIADDIAYKYEAERHGHAPDSVSYVLGLPVAGEDDPSRAIRLALALKEAEEGIARDAGGDLGLTLGIQRGEAIVTRQGGAAWDYELLDTTMEFARRLVDRAVTGDIVVGGMVYRVAKSEWRFEECSGPQGPRAPSEPNLTPEADPASEDRDPLHRPARIYRLRGAKERSERLRERGATPMLVGRELELKVLKDAYRDVVVHRRKQHVAVIGEPGVGKRALVSAFLATIPKDDATVLRSAARAATADTPYAIVADLGRDLLGLGESEGRREIHRRLQATAAFLYPEPEEASLAAALIETMGKLLGAPPVSPGEVVPAPPAGSDQDDADLRRRLISMALRRIEDRLTQDRPLILAIEDAHWADSQSWEISLEVLRENTQRPVLTLVTARPDERILDTLTETAATVLTVEELSPQDRLRLVLSRFAPGEDAAPLAQEIVKRAGGNPFFLCEVIDALVDRDIVSASPEHGGKLVWVRREASISVPVSVEALVATRLDRLPADQRQVLAHAAVLGRAFCAADVGALLDRPVEGELARLARRGLIDAAASGYHFRNEMTLAVAHELVPAEERSVLHRRAAELVKRAPGYREGQDDALVAHHLEAAGDAAEAARSYQQAATHALDVRANAEAFHHLSRVIELLPKEAVAERFAARAERESILRAWAQRHKQLRELHHMKREAEALGDPTRLADVMTRLAQLYLDVGRAPIAKRMLGPALDCARRAGDRVAEAAVLRVEACLASEIGQNAEALDLSARALALSDDGPGGTGAAEGQPVARFASRRALLERAQILNIRGTTLWTMSRLREAIMAYAEALVIYRHLSVPRQEARALNNMGIVFAALGEYEEALTHYKRSLKIDTELGDRVQVGLKLGNIGQTYLEVGELDKAEQYLDKALVVSEQLEDTVNRTDAMITLAQVYLKRRDAQGARALCEQGLALATQHRHLYQEVRGMVYLSLAQLEAGDAPEASLELARTAVQKSRAATMPVGEIHGMVAEARALAALGRTDEAEGRAADAVRLLGNTRDPEGAEEILYVHAQLARTVGRDADAQASLLRAYREVQSKARRLADPALRARYLESQPASQIVREATAAE
jgi:serine/threonine protein kinase/tetratricopeptide (TPR) repeat protein